MEIPELKKFLTSLTPISQMQYQLWDLNGKMIFPEAKEMPHEPHFIRELQHFAGMVTKQNQYRHVYVGDRHFVYGYPLANGHGLMGALIAIESVPSSEKRDVSDHALSLQGVSKMESFLANLAEMVQANWVAQDEINELAEELEHTFEDLYLFGKIASQIKSLKFSNEMLKELITNLFNNLRADVAFAFLPKRSAYNTLVTKPHLEDQLKNDLLLYQQLIDRIPADTPSLKEKYFVLNDSIDDPAYRNVFPMPYRFLGVKIEHEEGFFGWLGLVSFNMKEIFRQGELRLMISLAEQLSVVIANTSLYQDLEYFIINMVKSLVFAIEAKDQYTRGHSERVSKLSMRLGERLGLKGKQYDELRWASILHDIGKIGIPESILNKPDRLSDEEFAIIREHPAKGYEILKPVSQLEGSLPGVLHHHEQFDGNGYPNGLKGEEIPLIARIIAVADTFDAISSTRAYRNAKSCHQAMSIISQVSGSQLDPEIVGVLKAIAANEGHLLGMIDHAK